MGLENNVVKSPESFNVLNDQSIEMMKKLTAQDESTPERSQTDAKARMAQVIQKHYPCTNINEEQSFDEHYKCLEEKIADAYSKKGTIFSNSHNLAHTELTALKKTLDQEVIVKVVGLKKKPTTLFVEFFQKLAQRGSYNIEQVKKIDRNLDTTSQSIFSSEKLLQQLHKTLTPREYSQAYCEYQFQYIEWDAAPNLLPLKHAAELNKTLAERPAYPMKALKKIEKKVAAQSEKSRSQIDEIPIDDTFEQAPRRTIRC